MIDAVRRSGAGVSSVALWRYELLVRRGGQLRLLEAREVIDAPWRPGLIEAPPRPFASNGERVVRFAQRLQGAADLDPLLGWTAVGALGLRLRWRTSWHQGLDTEKLAEACRAGEVDAADLRKLAEVAGRLLARAHVRAPLRDGGAALPAIAAAIGGAPGALVADTETAVAGYLPRVRADHRLLRRLRATWGDTLGWRDTPWW